MLERVKSAFDALRNVRSASAIIGQSLEQVRAQIEDLKSRRDDIEALPVDQATAEFRATRAMQYQIQRAQQEIDPPALFTVSNERWNAAGRSTPDFGALVLAYLGDQLIESVIQQIALIYEDAPGVTDTERKKMLDENDQQILDAELSEEAIIRHGETQGLILGRRVDADPRAVLAADEALP